MKFILPHVYRTVALRETCKSMVIKKSHELRQAYRKLATKLCLDGKLPDPQLMFHMSHFEVGQVVQSRNSALIQK